MIKIPTTAAGRPNARHAACTAVTVLALSLSLAVTGCGSSGHVHFAKTKFVLHAGLAFGAFHRYIYKPYKAGDFTPVSSHKLTIVKAGAAGLFAYHEIKIALVDAQSSPTLSKLVSPLTRSLRRADARNRTGDPFITRHGRARVRRGPRSICRGQPVMSATRAGVLRSHLAC